MSQQQRTSEQGRDEVDDQRQQKQSDREGTFGDRAAQARTADDPRAQAPRDRAGMPSTGDEQL